MVSRTTGSSNGLEWHLRFRLVPYREARNKTDSVTQVWPTLAFCIAPTEIRPVGALRTSTCARSYLGACRSLSTGSHALGVKLGRMYNKSVPFCLHPAV